MLDLARFTIRRMGFDDLTSVLSWRNHPDVRRYMITQHEITLEEHQRWFERASQDSSRRLLIVEQNHDSLGFVHFSHVAPGGISNWGFYAVPNSPKGSGKKIGKTALDYAFRELELYKVCGQALEFNEASIRLHHALGFAREGILGNQEWVGDARPDLICFGILSHEWLKTSST